MLEMRLLQIAQMDLGEPYDLLEQLAPEFFIQRRQKLQKRPRLSRRRQPLAAPRLSSNPQQTPPNRPPVLLAAFTRLLPFANLRMCRQMARCRILCRCVGMRFWMRWPTLAAPCAPILTRGFGAMCPSI